MTQCYHTDFIFVNIGQKLYYQGHFLSKPKFREGYLLFLSFHRSSQIITVVHFECRFENTKVGQSTQIAPPRPDIDQRRLALINPHVVNRIRLREDGAAIRESRPVSANCHI